MKKKSHRWFIATRGSFLPCSWQGWSVYVGFLTYLVGAALIIAGHGGEAKYVAIEIAGQWMVATVVVTLFAQRRS